MSENFFTLHIGSPGVGWQPGQLFSPVLGQSRLNIQQLKQQLSFVEQLRHQPMLLLLIVLVVNLRPVVFGLSAREFVAWLNGLSV